MKKGRSLKSKDGVHPVDRHVGQRVRLARVSKGLSQTTLANAVGLTFQQVQKYEKGTNRVSASRLFEFAKFLDVEISYFFEGAADDAGSGMRKRAPNFGSIVERVDMEILSTLGSIEDAGLKRKLLDLINHLRGGGQASDIGDQPRSK